MLLVMGGTTVIYHILLGSLANDGSESLVKFMGWGTGLLGIFWMLLIALDLLAPREGMDIILRFEKPPPTIAPHRAGLFKRLDRITNWTLIIGFSGYLLLRGYVLYFDPSTQVQYITKGQGALDEAVGRYDTYLSIRPDTVNFDRTLAPTEANKYRTLITVVNEVIERPVPYYTSEQTYRTYDQLVTSRLEATINQRRQDVSTKTRRTIDRDWQQVFDLMSVMILGICMCLSLYKFALKTKDEFKRGLEDGAQTQASE